MDLKDEPSSFHALIPHLPESPCTLRQQDKTMIHCIRRGSTVSKNKYYDLNLSKALSKNRLIGLLRMMKGYHWLYIGATVALAIATVSRTGIFLVLRRFVDEIGRAHV